MLPLTLSLSRHYYSTRACVRTAIRLVSAVNRSEPPQLLFAPLPARAASAGGWLAGHEFSAMAELLEQPRRLTASAKPLRLGTALFPPGCCIDASG